MAERAELEPDDALLQLPSLRPALVAGAIVVMLLLASLVALHTKVPLVAAGEFKVVATAGADHVQAPAAGTISQLLSLEGARVSKGQVVVEMRSDKIAALETERQHLQAELAKMTALGEVLSRQQAVAKAGTGQLGRAMQDRISAARSKSAAAEALAATGENLAAAGVGSNSDKLRAQLQSAAANGELRDLRYSALDAQQMMALRALGFERDLSDLDLRIGEKAASLQQVEGVLAALVAANVRTVADPTHAGSHLIQLLAPYDGTVVELGKHRVGTLVETGTVLLRIARADSPLEAEIVLRDRQAARLGKNAEVKLMYDAFPFTQYGMQSARIRWVSPVAEDGAVTARALVTQHHFRVAQHERGVYPGMMGTVRAVVDERSVLDLLLDPLRQVSGHFGFAT